jgi:hypothetical protein
VTDKDWFVADVEADFEESVRIDRADDGRDHRLSSIETYHVTEEAEQFMNDFFSRLLGRSDDMRSGSNYWLYGYYGSGKSHVLSVLRGLMDSEWLRDQSEIWPLLVNERDLDDLKKTWTSIHDEHEVIPISVNLLKHQGQRQRSFSEIILQAAHTSEHLTGVSDGLSPQMEVAYFEDWYRTTDGWDERTQRARQALSDTVKETNAYDWEDVQQYGALADVVLPTLFAEQTGTEDGLSDLTPSDLDPEAMIGRLETLRQEREAEYGRPVRLVLLLDEVSLFIGTDFDRVTELQTVAEKVDDIGDGNIQLVATAQAKIEDAQTQFAAQDAGFNVLKDRFPHQFGLPSRHVGEISTQRLLKKSEAGRRTTERTLEEADNDPSTLLVYSGIESNIDPPLDDIDHEQLLDFYPLLPYQPALFLELLSNLRQEAHDPSKSIFSGTARAILALVHGLLQEWLEAGESAHAVSMVDFYDLIQPELEDITPQDVGVVDEIEGDTDTTETDVAVAKAVLLLQHVPDTIPMSERNIAVAVLSDLNGPTQFQMENRVEESLQRLRKYVRPTHDDAGPRYAFTPPEEREIIEAAEANLADPDWDAIIAALDDYLWEEVVRDLSLPTSAEYGDTSEQYPVRYEFQVDGTSFDTTVEAADALDVEIAVQGVNPTVDAVEYESDPLEWQIGEDGINDLRQSLVEWWALNTAVGDRALPQSVERDLSNRATRVTSKLLGALGTGKFEIKDRSDIRGKSAAVKEFIDVHYPDDFHPTMLQVDAEYLAELRGLGADEPLPDWAQRIEVATEEPATHGGSIQNNVRALTGKQLTQSEGTLAMSTILDGIVGQKPIYENARPALCAIIWGLCRKGDFLPVNEERDSVELSAVIDLNALSTTRLRISRGPSPADILRTGGFLKNTETIPDGIVRLQEANEALSDRIESLAEDVGLVAESDIQTETVRSLLIDFADTLESAAEKARERRAAVKSGDTDWQAVVDGTNEAQDWLEQVVDLWNTRLPDLVRLDGQMALVEQSFEWLDEECATAAANLRESLVAFEGAWWTNDGWNQFSDARLVSPALDDAITDAWAAFQRKTDIEALMTDLDGHPWVRPLDEFESNVRSGFVGRYVTPLRRAASWYERVSTAVSIVTGSATGTDADDVVRATNALVDTAPLGVVAEDEPDGLRERLAELNNIIGDTTPEEVTAIGVVPDDRESIESELERLVDARELDVKRTESGVILR